MKKIATLVILVCVLITYQNNVYAAVRGDWHKYSFNRTGEDDVLITQNPPNAKTVSLYADFMILFALDKGNVTYKLKSPNEKLWWEVSISANKFIKITQKQIAEDKIDISQLWDNFTNGTKSNKSEPSIEEKVYSYIDLSNRKMWTGTPDYSENSATPSVLIRHQNMQVQFWLGGKSGKLLWVCEYPGNFLNKVSFDCLNVSGGQIIVVYDAS